MKSRRFFKKILSLKYLISFLIVIVITVFVLLYFVGGLKTSTVEIDNKEFTYEGFVDYSKKTDSEISTNLKIAETSTYIMFIDEKTTIISLVEKSSFVMPIGIDETVARNNPNNYSIKYTTATEKDPSNLILSYCLNNDYNNSVQAYESYKNSVFYHNELTGKDEQHYMLKYLNKATDGAQGVQILYTMGDFGAQATFLPRRFYATVYKPASVKYKTEAEWTKAVEDWEQNYMVTVGNLYNTFEERFRGNVDIGQTYTESSGATSAQKRYSGTVTIYDEEANTYFREVIIPGLEEDGISYNLPEPELDKNGDLVVKMDSIGNVYWTYRNVPVELLDYQSEYYQKYFNNENSPCTNNPFYLSSHYSYLKGCFQSALADGNKIPYSYYFTSDAGFPALIAPKVYKMLYSNDEALSNITDGVPIRYDAGGSEYTVYSSGFVARDENGNFIYDDQGCVVRQTYNNDVLDKDNEVFASESKRLGVFQVCLEFLLDEDGLEVTVLKEGLKDSSNVTEDDHEYEKINGRYQILSLTILPNFTSFNELDHGQIIIPDGSGAYMNFVMDNGGYGKTLRTYTNTYYGVDKANVYGTLSETPGNLMLGMYAIVNTTSGKEGGILSVIEKGTGQTMLTATTSGNADNSGANKVYYKADVRNTEAVRAGTAAVVSIFYKHDKQLCANDLQYKYIFLDASENNYSAVAKRYQKYLIERDELEFKDNTDTTLVNLNILGSFEKYSMFLGIRYMSPASLTTFDQAQEIIDELKSGGVDNISATYTGWTSENLEYSVGGSLKVEKKLGGKSSMQDFYNYCERNGVSFYPEMYIATTHDYDYIYGQNKYTTKSVGNLPAIHYSYDPATKRQDKKLSSTSYISPAYFKDITNKLLDKFNKLNIWNSDSSEFKSGYSLTDIGNSYAGNYASGKQIYQYESMLYQLETLKTLDESANLKISAPYDYAFKYVEIAVNIPSTATMYNALDVYIPFYQLVVSGLFDYTTEEINGLDSRNSNWYLMKAIETGSNLNYVVSYEDPKVLLETDYTYYYGAYYQNVKNQIISYTNELNALGIHECILTSHEVIEKGIVKVVYTNKKTKAEKIIYINTENSYNATYDIAGYGYDVR